VVRPQAAAQGGAAHAQFLCHRFGPQAGEVALQQNLQDPVCGAGKGEVAGFIEGRDAVVPVIVYGSALFHVQTSVFGVMEFFGVWCAAIHCRRNRSA
jgi:hypothetical protein